MRPSVIIERSNLDLPPIPDTRGDVAAIEELAADANSKVVVLDDDPTGTQTVHGVDVLTEGSAAALIQAFSNPERCVFILTNTRALHQANAAALVRQVIENVQRASSETGRPCCIINRGDSTLRGHFPAEIDAIRAGLATDIDGVCLVPAFLEAGRCTIQGIHYVTAGEQLVPVGDTEFAADSTFGYKASYLPEWVEEKTEGRIPAAEVALVSLDAIRRGGAQAVFRQLLALAPGKTIAVDCESHGDLEIFVHGVLLAERAGRRYVFRAGAGLVRVRAGISRRAPLDHREIVWPERRAGVIVVGSYVAKSTAQLRRAQALPGVCSIELRIEPLLDASTREAELVRAAAAMAEALASGRHALVYTSRELLSSAGRAGEIQVAQLVSGALVDLVRRLKTRPRFFIAKGGITSSDLAVKALGVRRARVLGQAVAGVPVWQLGAESRFPGMAYVVFPGNVGDEESLSALIAALSAAGGPPLAETN